MRKFVLIDHSLKDIGGHHFSYAREFIAAARRAGFEPILATHRRFRDGGTLASGCRVLPLFRNESYSPLTFDMQAYRPGVQRAAHGSGLAAAWRAYRRARLARAFASDCRALFKQVGLRAGDQVFLATASELDLTGLGDYLREAAIDPGIDWHVQFHFGIFQGRDPDYDAQAGAEGALREIFRAALAGLGGVRLYCYCTTEALSAQYRRLAVAPFQTLPYPVNSELRAASSLAASVEPVRIACLGHSRREKGFSALNGIIERLWGAYLRDGHAQLLVQTSRHQPRHALAACVAAQGPHGTTPPLEFAPFPLDLAGYTALVRSSDIGLLLYDSARYYARCSGVLLELLCAGVPVIVPAGCWLAEQIAEANQSYLEGLVHNAQRVLQRPGEMSTLRFGRDPTALECRVAAGCTLLLVRFRVTDGAGPGRYLRMELSQRDEHGAALPPDPLASTVVGTDAERPVCAGFALDPRARGLALQLRNAWHEEPTTLGQIEFYIHGGEPLPLAAVGLTVHQDAQASAALGELLQHYTHYRRGAAALASRCAAYHNADRLVAQLLATAAATGP